MTVINKITDIRVFEKSSGSGSKQAHGISSNLVSIFALKFHIKIYDADVCYLIVIVVWLPVKQSLNSKDIL